MKASEILKKLEFCKREYFIKKDNTRVNWSNITKVSDIKCCCIVGAMVLSSIGDRDIFIPTNEILALKGFNGKDNSERQKAILNVLVVNKKHRKFMNENNIRDIPDSPDYDPNSIEGFNNLPDMTKELAVKFLEENNL